MKKAAIVLAILSLASSACGGDGPVPANPAAAEEQVDESEPSSVPTSDPSSKPSSEPSSGEQAKSETPSLADTTAPAATPARSGNEPSPSNDANLPAPTALTAADIEAFDLLHADWTKADMESNGLKKESNEAAGETYYADDIVRYTYVDWFAEDVAVVDVIGDYPNGPKGVRVGQTFQKTMTLFPQEKDWQSSSDGVFYGGPLGDSDENDWGPAGYVTVDENGDRMITLVTGKIYPFLRLFFHEDVMTHYTIYRFSWD